MNEFKYLATKSEKYTFEDLCLLAKLLRADGGCPWDREQTHKSIRKDIIEETYEVIEAIDKDDPALMREELGDLLWQGGFHAELEREEGRADMSDIVHDICSKLVHRHPHVFGSVIAETSDVVLDNWEKIKTEEKKRNTVTSKLQSVPPALPALMRAQKIGKRAPFFDFADADEVLVKLEDEMQFYISFVLFRRKLEKYNLKFCTPTISDAGKEEFMVCEAYDLALACKNAYESKPVVPNSLDYRGRERFLVITGPNQGGKTTLARGIGQIVYFSMLGLEAPAGKVTVPIFNDIMTHFEVEESLDTGAGKLKEELKRLKPMMESEHERCFIVLNELFTTAASYDAYVMGSHVIKHFIEDDYYGIYVTHIQELARETEQIASLVAGIADDGKTRTYKIERKPAEGVGHASTLVDKYRLNYEEIKERLNR